MESKYRPWDLFVKLDPWHLPLWYHAPISQGQNLVGSFTIAWPQNRDWLLSYRHFFPATSMFFPPQNTWRVEGKKHLLASGNLHVNFFCFIPPPLVISPTPKSPLLGYQLYHGSEPCPLHLTDSRSTCEPEPLLREQGSARRSWRSWKEQRWGREECCFLACPLLLALFS